MVRGSTIVDKSLWVANVCSGSGLYINLTGLQVYQIWSGHVFRYKLYILELNFILYMYCK
jgi:hypothetical protein